MRAKLVLHVDGNNVSDIDPEIRSRVDAVISKTGQVLESRKAKFPASHFMLVAEAGQAFMDIMDERAHQKLSYSEAHDDDHDAGELAYAAAAFAVPKNAQVDIMVGNRERWSRAGWAGLATILWPTRWDLPTSAGNRQDLVRAGAMIVAEIERIDRALEKSKAENGGEVAW